MKHRYLFGFCIIFLSLISKYSYSQDVNINIGAKTLGLIPVLMGEIEYGFSDQSIRVNYFSNFEFEMFGSSKYQGASVEYSFNEEKNEFNSNKIYIGIGEAEKREGSSSDENYKFMGIGYEKRYIRTNKGTLGNKYLFTRYYLNYVEEESLFLFNIPIEEYFILGFSIGIGY